MAYPQYVYLDGVQDFSSLRKLCHNGYITMVSPQCVSSDDMKVGYCVRMPCDMVFTDMFFPQCVIR